MLEKHVFLKPEECVKVHYDVLQNIVTPGEQMSCAVCRPVGNCLNEDSSLENLVGFPFDTSPLLVRLLLVYRYCK